MCSTHVLREQQQPAGLALVRRYEFRRGAGHAQLVKCCPALPSVDEGTRRVAEPNRRRTEPPVKIL